MDKWKSLQSRFVMYYEIFADIINCILKSEDDYEMLKETLLCKVNCEEIYESDDLLASDVYFSIMHHLTREEKVTKTEWIYFKECLEGKRNYNMDEKINHINSQ